MRESQQHDAQVASERLEVQIKITAEREKTIDSLKAQLEKQINETARAKQETDKLVHDQNVKLSKEFATQYEAQIR